jgi:23S rRNA (cytosine1962-C5)-methyltransferase
MLSISNTELNELLAAALQQRQPMLEQAHQQALRLFNGYAEGAPDLVVEVYATTLLLSGRHSNLDKARLLIKAARELYLAQLPWLTCVVEKYRSSQVEQERKGVISFGSQPATAIAENGIQYAVDLQLNQDSSFYLDTRALRQWLAAHAAGKRVFNTFAYTGSLGIAALAGGAAHVRQVDLNRTFLGLAHHSRALNDLDAEKMKLMPVDFFMAVGSLKREQTLFDLVILDPPFFSTTERGRVNLNGETTRLINKVRPLIADGGQLVVVNNALFYSGQEFMQELELLCQGGYLALEGTIAVPPDCTGFKTDSASSYPVDPAPFNHPTKIAILNVRRKA